MLEPVELRLQVVVQVQPVQPVLQEITVNQDYLELQVQQVVQVL